MWSKKRFLALVLSVILAAGSVGLTAYAAPSPSSGGTTVSRGNRRDPSPPPAPVTIENPVVPLAELPSEPSVEIPEEEVPLAVISDEEVPLAMLPSEEVQVPVISKEEVPLVGLPKTGDSSKNRFWLMLFAGSGAGIVTLEMMNRRSRRRSKEK